MFLIEGCLDVEFAFSCHSIILTELRVGSLLKMLKTVQAGGACVLFKTHPGIQITYVSKLCFR